jgi:uncharacterized RmlC-like cupin family protein
MDERRVLLVRASEAKPPTGPATPGMDRRQLLDHDDRWIGWVRTEPGIEGGWHHHGGRDTYIFVARGEIRIEFGPGGHDAVEGTPGDFIFVPKQTIHREITGADDTGELFLIRIGTGPQVVNVDEPDPAI